ncbi:MAG: hypothetical protein H6739_28210 [Alphaproteobacteria bacterium]|nr:hypothetical protein [Alphaproteobacteria bacterium]
MVINATLTLERLRAARPEHRRATVVPSRLQGIEARMWRRATAPDVARTPRLRLARLMLRNGRLAGAIRLLDPLVEEHPHLVEARLVRGVARYLSGAVKAGRADLLSAALLRPSDAALRDFATAALEA